MGKTKIQITFTYDGADYEYEHVVNTILSLDTAELLVGGLLFDAGWSTDTKFEDFDLRISEIKSSK